MNSATVINLGRRHPDMLGLLARCVAATALLASMLLGGCIEILKVTTGPGRQPEDRPDVPFINDRAPSCDVRSVQPIHIPWDTANPVVTGEWGGVLNPNRPGVFYVRKLKDSAHEKFQESTTQNKYRHHPWQPADLPKSEMGPLFELDPTGPTLSIVAEQMWDSSEFLPSLSVQDWFEQSDDLDHYTITEAHRLMIRPAGSKAPGQPGKVFRLNTIGRWCLHAVFQPGGRTIAVLSADGHYNQAVFLVPRPTFPGARYIEFFDTTTWQRLGKPVKLAESSDHFEIGQMWLSNDCLLVNCVNLMWLVPLPHREPTTPHAPGTREDQPPPPHFE